MLAEKQVLRDRYRIQRQLGQNAGRRTLLALDLHTQKLVVLKILSFNSGFRWEDLKLFEREAETLKSLSHPAIPRYLDFFELDLPAQRGFVLVQTYIDAISLQEWIKRGRTLSGDEVKHIAKALLNVLSYLHNRNPAVIHRDIKPSNILLKGDRSAHKVGKLYLIDFGSVQTAVREIGTMTTVGTYGYMPPEQFSGRAFPASDLYSLGATLIYLVTGTHPADLLQEDLQLQFEPVTNLAPSFVQWLKQMTHPNRKQRFSSAQVALATLEQPVLQNQLLESSTKTAPLTLQQPDHSKVSLYKNAEILEISIPPLDDSELSGYAGELLVDFASYCLFYIGTCYVIYQIFFGFLPSTNWFRILIYLLFLLGGAYGVWKWFFMLNADTCIRIDRKWMNVTKTAFGIQRRFFRASRNSLCKLTYVKRLYRPDGEAGITEVPPELNIWAQQRDRVTGNNIISYRIGQSLVPGREKQFYGYLTTGELEWLAQELSNWLGIPIAKE
ncbi:MAG: serine/threonine protein kinase [Kastovskya adunca ATA6-11-RM4]|jgi:serine/threonine protein kinase|nr:serine/threonine protein kinase [Kastovskya adunca ATA6-11-RM4]